MRLRVRKLLLVAALVTAGCDSGSGPSVGTPSDTKSAGNVAGAVGAPTEAGKKVSKSWKKKREGQAATPIGTMD
jgi:hypothetical protein